MRRERWALLGCRCGAGLTPQNMRRLPPLSVLAPDRPASIGVRVDPIVCPGCVTRREMENAALALPRPVEDVYAVPLPWSLA